MKKKIYILSIFIALILIFGFIFFQNKEGAENTSIKNIERNQIDRNSPEQKKLQDDYQKQAKEILKPFFDNKTSKGIADELSSLIVPYEYRNVHLSLIMGFDKIERGSQLSNQAEIEEGIEAILDLMEKNPWLGK